LLLRLAGAFLLRLAERTFCGLLFHEPPRNTRHSSASPSGKYCSGEYLPAQTMGLAMFCMADPAAYAWLDIFPFQQPFAIQACLPT
jgi:hypothetical protein